MQYKVDITITKTLTTYFEAPSAGKAVLIAEQELRDFADEALWKETTIIHCKDGDNEVKLEQVNYSK